MSSSLIERLRHLLPASSQPSTTSTARESSAMLTEWVQHASEDDASEVLRVLFSMPAKEWIEDSGDVASIVVGAIRRRVTGGSSPAPVGLQDAALTTQLREIYPQLASHSALQALLLRLCIATADEASLQCFAGLLVQTGPMDPRLQLEVFGDLLRCKTAAISAVFPKLLDAINNPNWSALVLDYANYIHRNGMSQSHPAADRSSQLISLLSTLSERLQLLQDKPPESDEERIQIGKQVTESVALSIALCDALACIGDKEAIASLNKSLQVEHRRLRVEAAAALAKLGVEDAKKVLTAMAAEPIERLRVLAYAEELGVLDDVEEEFSNIVARAEAEFVMHLAQPTQIGIAPQHIELLDQREQSWPGYEEPRNCFLFQFVYQFPSGEFTNVGIAGPVVMTFESDLTVLSHDDIYAIFAGWHVQHPDIFGVEAERVAGQDEIHMQRMMRSLTESEDFDDVYPAVLGTMLERRFLIASASRKDESGWAMVSEDAVSWVSLGNPERPLGEGDAFHLFIGRALLRSFN